MERKQDHSDGWEPPGGYRFRPLESTDCQEVIGTLYWFLDGELTPERKKEIQHHLDDCSPCLEAFDFEAELKLFVARKCRDQVPEELKRRVLNALREASKSHPGAERRRGMRSV
jgi:mycothiol system anti-sigma-R factor